MLTDLEIAQQATIWPIEKIAETIGLKPEDLDLYGRYKAKIHWQDIKKAPQEGKLILVTAINPTKAGEGKSTTTIGLADALNALGKKTMVALREPSFGPVMGIKGGAAGGGYAQVIPMEDINLHFTGDFHAITAANNAIAAMIDNHLHQGNSLRIDPTRIVWHRCLDLNDRALRHVVVGLGGSANGVPREDHFDISVASEIMAVLCLSTSVEDFRSRISRMVVAYTYDRRPVTVDDIQATGIVTLIMKDALMPNLVQTLEHTPALVHGGPFANIAHGCNSVIATKTALNLADYVVTEAGFGADLGAEKFLDIKCPTASLKPSCVVIVATVRALKMHGGMKKEELENENVEALLKGTENLKKHIENIRKYHVPYVIAVNRFPTDTIAELNTLAEWAEQQGHPYALSDVFCLGSQGGLELAEQVLKQIQDHDGASTFQPLYSYEETVKQKIKTICRQIYGADAVTFTKEANSQLLLLKKNGWDHLPVCIAKTPYSLSDNAKLYGRPENFQITIRELRPSIGAGFIVALAGDIMTMPGLPEEPAANHMDYVDGKVVGLF
ncbi:MAG TPA: formate--tetrahydrofolate ligase [Candidatus Pelethenecus faecipullorum]|uniref:Formate--tetrahydrofolate ligase n=1 Tax=Candidatus Pelethenecus faecipullorum TaxID=2840900 RepID=A0A9D1GRN5_9MOLU|nr:formate--tetrahydrofolate ligase [Candidatus Pelethenecus faecipullorum]